MVEMRISRAEEVPRLRELWQAAFGDEERYIDNFFQHYYAPGRVLVALEEGRILSMSAWFDTDFVTPDGNRWRSAYLYAVATDPDSRGRGLAGGLLRYAAFYLREEHGMQCLTTVPARPDLHVFFGGNGFRECFVLEQEEVLALRLPAPGEDCQLRPASAAEYARAREGLLAGTAHIAYPEEALAYQAGCCALSGGGLYVGRTASGPICLCAEGAGDGLVVVKELLGNGRGGTVLASLAKAIPSERYLVRRPADASRPGGAWKFGMLQWLYPGLEGRWDWSSTAYLGLAFD